VVTSLVSGETARGSLEEEVSRALSSQSPADGRSSGQHEHVQGGAHRAQRPAQPADGRRVPPHQQPAAEPAAERPVAPHGRPNGTPQADQADGRPLSEPVDTTKRQDRVLDEAAAGSPAGRGIEG
jgi:hypothetical protein